MNEGVFNLFIHHNKRHCAHNCKTFTTKYKCFSKMDGIIFAILQNLKNTLVNALDGWWKNWTCNIPLIPVRQFVNWMETYKNVQHKYYHTIIESSYTNIMAPLTQILQQSPQFGGGCVDMDIWNVPERNGMQCILQKLYININQIQTF